MGEYLLCLRRIFHCSALRTVNITKSGRASVWVCARALCARVSGGKTKIGQAVNILRNYFCPPQPRVRAVEQNRSEWRSELVLDISLLGDTKVFLTITPGSGLC